jgi:hypothetical protein
VSKAETEKGLASLRRQATAELESLGRERDRLVRLIEFIDEYAINGSGRSARPRRRRKRPRRLSLLEVIQERPGVRTSMLAMMAGRSSEEVSDELEGYEERGFVRRERLGWCISDNG